MNKSMLETVEISKEINVEDLTGPAIVILGTTLQEEVSPLLNNYGKEDGEFEMWIETSKGLRLIGRTNPSFDDLFAMTLVGYRIVEIIEGNAIELSDAELIKKITI